MRNEKLCFLVISCARDQRKENPANLAVIACRGSLATCVERTQPQRRGLSRRAQRKHARCCHRIDLGSAHAEQTHKVKTNKETLTTSLSTRAIVKTANESADHFWYSNYLTGQAAGWRCDKLIVQNVGDILIY